MDLDSAAVPELEEYLRSCGAPWATVPTVLTISVRQLSPGEHGRGELTASIVQTRSECYMHSIREFAKVCQRINARQAAGKSQD